ncbi:MAG: cytidylate kinase-like family protein [bacterium]
MIVTISRQAASNGELIAHMVAERLSLKVFGEEIIDEVARRLHKEPESIKRLDESLISPVEAILMEWRESVSEQMYSRQLRAAVRSIARTKNAVIVGRGANFILRGAECLHVRIVAQLDLRVGMYVAGEGVNEKEALEWIKKTDKRRHEFIHKYFDAEIENPLNYDLVLNLGGLPLEQAVDIIVRAAIDKVQSKIPDEPQATLPQYVELLGKRHWKSKPITTR